MKAFFAFRSLYIYSKMLHESHLWRIFRRFQCSVLNINIVRRKSIVLLESVKLTLRNNLGITFWEIQNLRRTKTHQNYRDIFIILKLASAFAFRLFLQMQFGPSIFSLTVNFESDIHTSTWRTNLCKGIRWQLEVLSIFRALTSK